MTTVLGIWDGHDAGAALVNRNGIVTAVNEERLSRRKCETGFPRLSIAECLRLSGLAPSDISHIAACTSDPAKTLTRIFPFLKEQYYLIRRRQKERSSFHALAKSFKYRFTELTPNSVSRLLSRHSLIHSLRQCGFHNVSLEIIQHHRAHAAAAALCSPYEKCSVLTLDGVGDGLCGSLYHYDGTELHAIATLPATWSLGIFFEHVTNLMNMRELEDEGKVMALANFAYPVMESDNPLMSLVTINKFSIHSRFRSNRLYRELKRIHWRYPSEQFAFMAQQVLEKKVVELVNAAHDKTGDHCLALSGGVFSNIKLNMRIATETRFSRNFVFPHMGDGGLAVGAALDAMNRRHRLVKRWDGVSLSWGPAYDSAAIRDVLENSNYHWRVTSKPGKEAAEYLLKNFIIMWFQGGMEFGPRSLGNRSLLARPDSVAVKDQLNLVQKRRVWYQPFCPSLLHEDAHELLETEGRQDLDDNCFMTTAYRVRPAYRALMAAVTNVDGTCRPHLVGTENPPYRGLLLQLKKKFGVGVVLNTSCNVHGNPVVCSPRDAIDMFSNTALPLMIIGNFVISKKKEILH